MDTSSSLLWFFISFHLYLANCRWQTAPSLFTTRHGPVSGMIFKFESDSLSPAEVFRGFHFASSKRFEEPIGSVEQWMEVRRFSGQNRGCVCPQSLDKERQSIVNYSSIKMTNLRRLQPYIIRQHEDCLVLNMFVSSKGEFYRIILIENILF